MNRAEFEILIGKYLDGICEPEEAESLLAELDASEEARKLFARHLYHEKTISGEISFLYSRARKISLRRWIITAAAAVAVLVVLAFVFFAGNSTIPDVAEELPTILPDEAPSPGPVKKHRVVEKDTATAPVPPKKLVEESPAPAEKKGPKLAGEPAPPVEKESPAPEQPKKKPAFVEKSREPEKPVPPAREEPKKKFIKTGQAPAPVFLAITVDDSPGSKGKLQVRRGKRWQTVKATDISENGTFQWQADEPIRASRLARFTTADGTQISLKKATLSLGGVEPVTLVLERGEIFCEVAPGEKKDEKVETTKTESEGKATFIVCTKEAEVRAFATRFGVKYASGRTTVVVTEGEVILANTKGEVTVPAGTSSSAVKTSAPKKPKRVKSGKYFGWRYQLASPVVWRRDFDKKGSLDGKYVVLDEPGGKVSAAESRPSIKRRGPDPDVKIGFHAASKERGGTGYFFKIPEKFEMHLRIKSEKPGNFDLYINLPLDKPDDQLEGFSAIGVLVEPEWKEIVLLAKDFKPEKNTRPYQVGICIDNMQFFGVGTGKLYLDRIIVRGESRK